ncbi:MAG: FAD-dependent oxidoreductase [Lachnospiraceae bacterium]|nr:FAD-dependent oxidoreductase [Lachnospiraceae bacterium]
MFQSLWHATAKVQNHKTLQHNAKTDYLIIGGGICGVLCAYFLQQEGVDYILVEGNRIGGGNTGNTTAKITSQHGLIYDHLLHSMGKEKTALYLEAHQKALDQYRELAKIIDCDFEEKYAGVYSCESQQAIEQEIDALRSIGFPAEYAEQLPLPFSIKGAVLFPKQAQFHPLKFLSKISEPLNIYEHTFVQKIDGHTVYTDRGIITAGKIIVATHFPFLNKRGSYFLKLYQSRSYVIALNNAADVNGIYIDADKKGLSFRNYGNLLILGDGGGRTGKQHENWKMLRNFATSAYPDAKEIYHWAAQDCISLDGVPYIGNYSKHTPDLYVASGFNKWGMTSSMAAAMILRDLVLGRENVYKEVFSPSRSILKPQLFLNAMESTGNLLFPSLKRCPHMGCALKWNPQEHTWDCPCHGSRFKEDGKLIDVPAVKDAHLL